MVSSWGVLIFPDFISKAFIKAVKCSLRAFRVSLQLALFRILVVIIYILTWFKQPTYVGCLMSLGALQRKNVLHGVLMRELRQFTAAPCVEAFTFFWKHQSPQADLIDAQHPFNSPQLASCIH